jgi:hypothetical protein
LATSGRASGAVAEGWGRSPTAFPSMVTWAVLTASDAVQTQAKEEWSPALSYVPVQKAAFLGET